MHGLARNECPQEWQHVHRHESVFGCTHVIMPDEPVISSVRHRWPIGCDRDKYTHTYLPGTPFRQLFPPDFLYSAAAASVFLTQPLGRRSPKHTIGCLPVLRSGSHTVCLPCKLEAPGCAAQAAWEVRAAGSGGHPPRTDARCTLAAQRVVSCMTERGQL
jgi:hypothetical protein